MKAKRDVKKGGYKDILHFKVNVGHVNAWLVGIKVTSWGICSEKLHFPSACGLSIHCSLMASQGPVGARTGNISWTRPLQTTHHSHSLLSNSHLVAISTINLTWFLRTEKCQRSWRKPEQTKGKETKKKGPRSDLGVEYQI